MRASAFPPAAIGAATGGSFGTLAARSPYGSEASSGRGAPPAARLLAAADGQHVAGAGAGNVHELPVVLGQLRAIDQHLAGAGRLGGPRHDLRDAGCGVGEALGAELRAVVGDHLGYAVARSPDADAVRHAAAHAKYLPRGRLRARVG